MARDYAQRGNGRRQARGRGTGANRGVPGWVWLAAGLSVGLAIAAFIYITRPATPVAVEAAAAPAAPATARKDGPIPLPPKEKPRFTFYEILRDQEIVIPREDTRAATPPPSAAGAAPAQSTSYVIQVASYRVEDEAERQKANLALLGIESRIERVTIDDTDTYYRVRIGPERDWQRVQTTMARLEDNGIEALLIRLK